MIIIVGIFVSGFICCLELIFNQACYLPPKLSRFRRLYIIRCPSSSKKFNETKNEELSAIGSPQIGKKLTHGKSQSNDKIIPLMEKRFSLKFQAKHRFPQ